MKYDELSTSEESESEEESEISEDSEVEITEKMEENENKIDLTSPSNSPPHTPTSFTNKEETKLCVTCNKANTTKVWRKGANGKNNLCNACGIKYSRSLKKSKSNKYNTDDNNIIDITPIEINEDEENISDKEEIITNTQPQSRLLFPILHVKGGESPKTPKTSKKKTSSKTSSKTKTSKTEITIQEQTTPSNSSRKRKATTPSKSAGLSNQNSPSSSNNKTPKTPKTPNKKTPLSNLEKNSPKSQTKSPRKSATASPRTPLSSSRSSTRYNTRSIDSIDVTSLCRKTMQTLMSHRYSFPFLTPVDPIALNIPDYPLIIKQPMDFGTIKTNFENGKYSTIKEFVEHIHLVFTNACKYNPPGSDVNIMSQTLRDLFISKFAPSFDIIIDSPFPSPSQPNSLSSLSSSPSLLSIRSSRSKILYSDNSEEITQLKRTVEILTKELEKLRKNKKEMSDYSEVPMTRDEKRNLSNDINTLESEHLASIIRIIKRNSKSCTEDSDEIIIDIDNLDTLTLRKLEIYVQKVKNKRERGKGKVNLKNSRRKALSKVHKLNLAVETEKLTTQKLEEVQKRLAELTSKSSSRNSIKNTPSSFSLSSNSLEIENTIPPPVIDNDNKKSGDESSSSSDSDSDSDSSDDSSSGSGSGSGSDSESGSDGDKDKEKNKNNGNNEKEKVPLSIPIPVKFSCFCC